MADFFTCVGCAYLKKGEYCKKKDNYISFAGYCPSNCWTSPNTMKK